MFSVCCDSRNEPQGCGCLRGEVKRKVKRNAAKEGQMLEMTSGAPNRASEEIKRRRRKEGGQGALVTKRGRQRLRPQMRRRLQHAEKANTVGREKEKGKKCALALVNASGKESPHQSLIASSSSS